MRVMGVVKPGLGCDYGRLHEWVNGHRTRRRLLGPSSVSCVDPYPLQTVMDPVARLGPERRAGVGRRVVESGHQVAGKKPGAPLRGRTDSFVAATDVPYATDVSRRWDAMRCRIRETAQGAPAQGLAGWGQSAYNTRCVRNWFPTVRHRRRATPDRVFPGAGGEAHRSGRPPPPAGRADAARGEGVLALRAPHPLDGERQGRHAG